jgi:methylenetetrahydrofolate reductase (NADPH)
MIEAGVLRSTGRRTGRLDEPLPEVELSIEIFPPKTAAAEERLWHNVELFAAVRPRFISVTCGAGGTGEDGTYPLALAVNRRFALPVAAHLTCAHAARSEIDLLLQRYWGDGIRRIVALRGDPPKGSAGYEPRADGYAFARDLVLGIREIAPFDISVACYPEVHPEAVDAQSDYGNLLAKIDAGADRAITQYCFDTDQILRLRDRLAADRPEIEYVPGIMPIHSFSQVKRFSAGCGAGIPGWLEALFEGVEDGSAVHGMIAASVVAEQCRRLAAEGLTRQHVYALNRAELPLAIVHLLRAAAPAL